MSVVVGLIDNGEIYMAADSACGSLDGSWVREDATPKVWRDGRFLIGVVGKCRVSDLIINSIEPEGFRTEYDWADAIREALRRGGALKVQNGIETMEAEVLIGCERQLFHIVSNFGIFAPKSNYHAIGAGAPYALGALHVMQGEDWIPGTKIHMAVEAAAAFSPIVGGKVHGLRLTQEQAA
jgi:ATP-dependent protease HslVU (ClpYQ) peptidase subunit